MLETEDTLQRCIAQFLERVTVPRAENCSNGAGVGTDIGTRENNQDRALVLFANFPRSPKRNFVMGVVCDGMGGMAHGEEAAVLSLSIFTSVLLRATKQPNSKRLWLAAMAANKSVHHEFNGRSGSTLSAIMITADTIVGTNAGDSRIYGLSPTGKFEQLSRDDTMAAALGEKADADFYKNQLVQYIGMGEGIHTHLFQRPRSDFKRIVVTTDGIHGLSNETFTEVSKVPSSGENYLHRLLLLNEVLGGRDNGSAIVLSLDEIETGTIFDQGLGLTLFSPFDKLEILIPTLGSEFPGEETLGELVESDEVDSHCPSKSSSSVSEVSAPHQRDREAGRRKRPVGRRKKNRNVQNDGELPFEKPAPSLEVHFTKEKL